MLGFSAVVFRFFSMILGLSSPQNFPPPLSAKEERQYFLNVKTDPDARRKLIEHNLRLVSHLVRKYYGAYPSQDELISIGSLGLIKAVDSFNCENGARFATYAAKCIQNEILMFFRAQKKTAGDVSIHETIDIDRDGNPLTYMDIICCDDTIAQELDLKVHAKRLYELVRYTLSPRERQIIVARYGLDGKAPKTQMEIAHALHISRSYVSRIEKKALQKMKAGFSSTPDFSDA